MLKKLIILSLTSLIPFFLSAESDVIIPGTPAKNNKTVPTTTWVESLDGDLRDTGGFMQEFTHLMLSLGFVLLLILAAGWILKRMVNQRVVQMNSSSNIKVLERRAVSAKTTVYLLEIEGTGILIAESPTGVQRLTEFPLASNDEPKSSFTKVYEKKSDNYSTT